MVAQRRLLGIVRAAHASERDDQAWLVGVAEALRNASDLGLGVHAYLFDLTGAERFRTTLHVAPGTSDQWQVPWALISENPVSRAFLADLHRTAPPAYSLRDEMSRIGSAGAELSALGPVIDGLARAGYEDFWGVNALEPSGRGCFLGLPVPAGTRVNGARRRTLALIAAHIAAGLRLRWCARPAAEDAVFDKRGNVEHAASALVQSDLDQLRCAARALVDVDSDPTPAAEATALQAWKALFAERWTLVDRFEENGRRYLVARKNAVALEDAPALSPRERQVAAFAALGHSNKYIAYELGIGVSAVAMRLKSAMKKLGITHRAELIQRAPWDVSAWTESDK
jgi:DNA-binding CsgD family transcriptional regulator